MQSLRTSENKVCFAKTCAAAGLDRGELRNIVIAIWPCSIIGGPFQNGQVAIALYWPKRGDNDLDSILNIARYGSTVIT